MRCAWTQLMEILPPRIRDKVDHTGRHALQELRLRINAPPQLVINGSDHWLSDIIKKEDITYILNMASQYSPWRTATIAQGYLTAPGGHRIGICGEAVYKDGAITGIRDVQSVSIRVARDFTGIIRSLSSISGSTLILGAPGWGKTTLLRDLIRKLSDQKTVCVVDERGELFPDGFLRGKKLDILTGCRKAPGIEMLLKTMGPDWIAVDEITSSEDCAALVQAANCGVHLLATAHAASRQDFLRRGIYQPLIQEKVMDTLLILQKDKSYIVERMAY